MCKCKVDENFGVKERTMDYNSAEEEESIGIVRENI